MPLMQERLAAMYRRYGMPLMQEQSAAMCWTQRLKTRWFFCADKLKSGHFFTLNTDVLNEHRQWPYPQIIIAVQSAVHSVLLLFFTMSGNSDQLVQIAFVMTVITQRHGTVAVI